MNAGVELGLHMMSDADNATERQILYLRDLLRNSSTDDAFETDDTILRTGVRATDEQAAQFVTEVNDWARGFSGDGLSRAGASKLIDVIKNAGLCAAFICAQTPILVVGHRTPALSAARAFMVRRYGMADW